MGRARACLPAWARLFPRDNNTRGLSCCAPLGLAPQLEMILQAHEYEGAQGMVLQEFFDSTAGKWRTDVGKAWAEEIYQRREAAAEEPGPSTAEEKKS